MCARSLPQCSSMRVAMCSKAIPSQWVLLLLPHDLGCCSSLFSKGTRSPDPTDCASLDALTRQTAQCGHTRAPLQSPNFSLPSARVPSLLWRDSKLRRVYSATAHKRKGSRRRWSTHVCQRTTETIGQCVHCWSVFYCQPGVASNAAIKVY